MHYLFILNEDFWLNEIDRKFAQPDSNIEDAI